ncbi:hypothetical protein H4R19_000025 [Coemansia spiralis]|nr:hypothetical protein H4R19_000025 [Coemansia spiralis]
MHAKLVSLVGASSSALALFIPPGAPAWGGVVGAGSVGSTFRVAWGPNGYITTSMGPGFSSQMRGMFGPHGGAVSNAISRVQVFPYAFNVVAPFV